MIKKYIILFVYNDKILHLYIIKITLKHQCHGKFNCFTEC